MYVPLPLYLVIMWIGGRRIAAYQPEVEIHVSPAPRATPLGPGLFGLHCKRFEAAINLYYSTYYLLPIASPPHCVDCSELRSSYSPPLLPVDSKIHCGTAHEPFKPSTSPPARDGTSQPQRVSLYRVRKGRVVDSALTVTGST